ncbi:hypothetical protein quinque_008998 [Culex quinquefasciatus]
MISQSWSNHRSHEYKESKSMHGVKRVIAFCILTAVLPASLIILPLYLRHTVFADVVYPIAESDIIEIRDGISSVFCQRHSLQMNSSFNAFQLNQKPEISQIRKHIRLKKSMVLPDDTLEYWGFYLLKGATVALKVCSRYDGSRILVVKGERNLRTCGLLEHNKNKFGPHFNSEHGQVLVTFESAAEIVDSSRSNKNNSGYYTSPDLGNHGGEDLTDEDMATSETAVPVPAKHSKYGSVLKNTLNSRQHKTTTEATTRTTIAGDNKVRKRHRGGPPKPEETVVGGPQGEDEVQQQRRRRHHGKHGHRDKISQPIGEVTGLSEAERTRAKRDTIYDRKINHGGNAMNNSNNTSDSVSSFENSLLTCYDGDILLAKSFPPSHLCQDVQYLESGLHMVTKHEIASDGYYYYIFYSDNDYVQNDIHAVFDIYKPTYQYANISESKGCINSTNCSFPIAFWSDERVIVEVPTRDGIEHEEDDITMLISTCQPRMAIYIIFPISVLFLVLTCAFL